MSLSNIKLVKLTVFKLKLPSCWEIGSETEITTTAWIVSKLTFLSSEETAGVQIWDFKNIFTWGINCISGRNVFGWITWQGTTALGWHKFGSSFSTVFTLDIILSSACLCVKWVLVECCHLLGVKRIQLWPNVIHICQKNSSSKIPIWSLKVSICATNIHTVHMYLLKSLSFLKFWKGSDKALPCHNITKPKFIKYIACLDEGILRYHD